MRTVKRTVPIVLEDDKDLRKTLAVFREVRNFSSLICFNGSKSLSSTCLQKAAYRQVEGRLHSYMTCIAIRW